MKPLRVILWAGIALLPAAGLPLRADDSGPAAAELKVLDARLQEQRAAAVRSRLVIYRDELQKLMTQRNSAGDAAAVAAVKDELESVNQALKRLAGIAAGQAEPPAKEETAEGEEPDETAIAAKRIDAIIARFAKAKTDAAPVKPATAGGPARQRVLKIEKASRNRDYSSYEGGAYWVYEASWAAWTLNDLVPGEYDVILRYTAKKDAGGKAIVRAAGQKLEVQIPPGESGQKELRLQAGTIKIQEPGVDVRVENGGLAKDAKYLWNLESVVLQPAGPRP